jgi:hypothetical protein
MRIIKPYGQSRIEQNTTNSTRVLIDKSEDRTRHDVSTFALNHDELVIAQWISTIDQAKGRQGRDRNAKNLAR